MRIQNSHVSFLLAAMLLTTAIPPSTSKAITDTQIDSRAYFQSRIKDPAFFRLNSTASLQDSLTSLELNKYILSSRSTNRHAVVLARINETSKADPEMYSESLDKSTQYVISRLGSILICESLHVIGDCGFRDFPKQFPILTYFPTSSRSHTSSRSGMQVNYEGSLALIAIEELSPGGPLWTRAITNIGEAAESYADAIALNPLAVDKITSLYEKAFSRRKCDEQY